MREHVGDLFDTPADALVIPINWRTKADGSAVMGAGVALQAGRRWAWLPAHWGMRIRYAAGPQLVTTYPADGPALIGYPTKGDWRRPSALADIAALLPTLVARANTAGWRTVGLPRLGCGKGGLDWVTQVRPLLARHLDDRFVVVHPGRAVHPGAVCY